MREALANTQQIVDHYDRARAFIELAGWLGLEVREIALQEALADAEGSKMTLSGVLFCERWPRS